MTGVLITKGNLDTETCIEEDDSKKQRENMAIDRPRREPQNRSFSHSVVRIQSWWHLGFGLSTLRYRHVYCLSHLIHGTLLGQLWKTNAVCTKVRSNSHKCSSSIALSPVVMQVIRASSCIQSTQQIQSQIDPAVDSEFRSSTCSPEKSTLRMCFNL